MTNPPVSAITFTMTTLPRKHLTAKQAAFAVNYFKLRNATQAAIQAGYSPHLIGYHTNNLLENVNIRAKIAELEAKVESEAIGTVSERKKRLTEIYRANLTDFVDEQGNITLKPSAAIAELVTEEHIVDQEASLSLRTKRLKLRDPIAAIAEQNKMERIGATDNITNNFNDIRILIVREPPKAKDIDRVIDLDSGATRLRSF